MFRLKKRIFFVARFHILFASTVLLLSCTQIELEDHSYQFNEAIESLGNKLLFLNAVRAAKDYPIQFSKIGSYTGNGRSDGNIDLSLPFAADIIGNPTALLSGTLRSQASFRTGVSSLQLVDLNTAEAQESLKRQFSINEFGYYLKQGWTGSIALTLMIEGVEISRDLLNGRDQIEIINGKKKTHKVDGIATRYNKHCNSNPNNIECWAKMAVDSACVAKKQYPTVHSRNGKQYVQFLNRANSECNYLFFQYFLEALFFSGGSFELDPDVKNKDKINKDEGQTAVYRSDKFAIDVNVSVPKASSPKINMSIDLFFDEGREKSYLGDEYHEMKTLKKLWQTLAEEDKENKQINVLLRSPERTVRFLGELIAAQTLIEDQFEPKVRVEDDLVEIFHVERGNNSSRSAVYVIDSEGERFEIPIPAYEKSDRHRSLVTLALTTDMLNSAISGKAIPSPTPVLISGD